MKQEQFMRRTTGFQHRLVPLLATLLLAMVMLTVGCERETDTKSAIIPANETLAVVNNKRISLAQFQRRLNLFLKQYGQLLITDEKQLARIKDIVINRMIEEELGGSPPAGGFRKRPVWLPPRTPD
jgi:hypothetical protein